MPNLYFDEAADLTRLQDHTITSLGYGSQGQSQALDLHNSGLQVIGGRRADASAEQTSADSFEGYGRAEATQRADIIFLLVPDEAMPDLNHPMVKAEQELYRVLGRLKD